MSGGHFDYKQYYICDIADSIEEYLTGRELEECDIEEYLKDFGEPLSKKKEAWVRRNKRTLPNQYEYSKETIREFKKGLNILHSTHSFRYKDFVYSSGITKSGSSQTPAALASSN